MISSLIALIPIMVFLSVAIVITARKWPKEPEWTCPECGKSYPCELSEWHLELQHDISNATESKE